MLEENGEKKKEEKKNTDVWKIKQEEKKKKKEAQEKETTNQVENNEAKEPTQSGKEIKPKKQKIAKTKQDKKQEEKTEVKDIKEQPKPEPVPIATTVIYQTLQKIDDKLTQKQKTSSRAYQQQLIGKYMNNYISKTDIIINIGIKKWSPQCQQVYIQNFNNCDQAELVCQYPDISYFMQGAVTKIFCQGIYIFANGSMLAKKGALNIVLMGQYYNIPVIGCGGSWNYNGWSPLDSDAVSDKYGENILDLYDWIDGKYLKCTILEVGGVNPKQVSVYPPLIYKNINLNSILW